MPIVLDAITPAATIAKKPCRNFRLFIAIFLDAAIAPAKHRAAKSAKQAGGVATGR
jgi:hypothetical protein